MDRPIGARHVDAAKKTEKQAAEKRRLDVQHHAPDHLHDHQRKNPDGQRCPTAGGHSLVGLSGKVKKHKVAPLIMSLVGFSDGELDKLLLSIRIRAVKEKVAPGAPRRR